MYDHDEKCLGRFGCRDMKGYTGWNEYGACVRNNVRLVLGVGIMYRKWESESLVSTGLFW